MAVARQDKPIHKRLDKIIFKVGDVLLLQGNADHIQDDEEIVIARRINKIWKEAYEFIEESGREENNNNNDNNDNNDTNDTNNNDTNINDNNNNNNNNDNDNNDNKEN